MAQEKFELTKQGCIELYEEITYLTTEARKQNVKAIQDARAQGDLSENADYDAARAEQARIEGRIAEIEAILKNSIIKISKEEQKSLDAELKELENTLKPAAIKLIEEFEARGTLTDEADINAFADARVNYAKIDGRIVAIKVIIEKAIIQDKSNKVSTGKEIEIEFDNGNKASYKLVGTIEADPLNGKISNTSPLGKAIMGYKVGDKISFKTETGKERKVTILSIK